MRTMTSIRSPNHFGELLDAAQREPVTIYPRGRPVAFSIYARYEALTQGLETAHSQASNSGSSGNCAFRGSGEKDYRCVLADRQADNCAKDEDLCSKYSGVVDPAHDEAGAERVTVLLDDAASGNIICYGCLYH